MGIEKDENGCYYTMAPNDIFKIFYETFEMITHCQIPKLWEKVLEILH